MYSPCHELVQALEWVRGEPRGVVPVLGGGGVDRPVLEEHCLSPGSKSFVAPKHELRGGCPCLAEAGCGGLGGSRLGRLGGAGSSVLGRLWGDASKSEGKGPPSASQGEGTWRRGLLCGAWRSPVPGTPQARGKKRGAWRLRELWWKGHRPCRGPLGVFYTYSKR